MGIAFGRKNAKIEFFTKSCTKWQESVGPISVNTDDHPIKDPNVKIGLGCFKSSPLDRSANVIAKKEEVLV